MRPTTAEEAAALLARASAAGRTVTPIGGGTHSRRGLPAREDDVLQTSGLSRLVEHNPADLTATVEAGMEAHAFAERIGGAGQFWPQAELRPGSTVGGVLAAAASGRARLRFGPVRDSLLEVVVATGDGRLVKGGGRTVKNVAGYDLPRLLVGSLGTLGVIVQATLKLWPLPPARGWFSCEGDLRERLALADKLRRELYRPAALLMGPGRLSLELVGPEEDVVAPDGMAPCAPPPEPSGAGLVEVGVPPVELPHLARLVEEQGYAYEAQLGVGACRVVVATAEDVQAVRALARRSHGHAIVVDAPEELRADPWGPPPPGLDLMRRIKEGFDPSGILSPGKLVGATA